MPRVRVVRPVGDVTHDTIENRVRQSEAYAAKPQGARPATVVRPTKTDGGCKTCDGRNCVGRCQF
jgi:hypothetical protein